VNISGTVDVPMDVSSGSNITVSSDGLILNDVMSLTTESGSDSVGTVTITAIGDISGDGKIDNTGAEGTLVPELEIRKSSASNVNIETTTEVIPEVEDIEADVDAVDLTIETPEDAKAFLTLKVASKLYQILLVDIAYAGTYAFMVDEHPWMRMNRNRNIPFSTRGRSLHNDIDLGPDGKPLFD